MVDWTRNSSIHLASKTVVTMEYGNPVTEVNYPSTWFERNKDLKPTAVIPKYQGSSDDLLRAVKGGIRNAVLSISTVKVFLAHYGRQMKATCKADWTSFGRVIGRARENITPWSIVSLADGESYTPTEPMISAAGIAKTPGAATDDPANWTERSVALYILVIYRLAKETNEEYADLLELRLGNQIVAEGGRGMSFNGVRKIYSSWIKDRSFLKQISAIDMFLYKFRNHPDAILRMGSLGSRFRDCAGLLSIGYAMLILKIKCGDLFDWVFISTMADEVFRMTKTGQESGELDSYFPYQADLGLVTKSAYSSKANPYLFTWIHIIGSLLGHKRSQNARFIFEGNYADVGLNAALVTWVFARGGEIEEEGNLSPRDALWVESQGTDPDTWYTLLKASGFRLPEVVRRAIRRQQDKIGEARKHTIGDFCKNNLTY